eukprot:8269819-Karenia_brevis.AAC.1
MKRIEQRLFVEIWRPSFMRVDGIVIAANSLCWTSVFGVRSRWAGMYAAERRTTTAITDGSQALSMTVQ